MQPLKPEPCKQSNLFSLALHQAAMQYGMESDEFGRVFEIARKHHQTCQQCKEYIDWVWENCTNPHPEIELETEEPQTDGGKPAWGTGG